MLERSFEHVIHAYGSLITYIGWALSCKDCDKQRSAQSAVSQSNQPYDSNVFVCQSVFFFRIMNDMTLK